MLRNLALEQDYAQAWVEWSHDGDGVAWDAAVGDGLGVAPRRDLAGRLDSGMSSEANIKLAAVIVSNDRASATAARLCRGVVTVVPVTSNVA